MQTYFSCQGATHIFSPLILLAFYGLCSVGEHRSHRSRRPRLFTSLIIYNCTSRGILNISHKNKKFTSQCAALDCCDKCAQLKRFENVFAKAVWYGVRASAQWLAHKLNHYREYVSAAGAVERQTKGQLRGNETARIM